MSIPYRFSPWARRGLARAHRNADAAGGALATRPRISVGLTLQAKKDGAITTAVSGNVDLMLYGPADIIGIDTRLIVRTEPKPGTRNFEPNYLAAIDFDPPDFPWLLTPARADASHRLRPWLVLVVVDRAVVRDLPALKPGQPLPSIQIAGAAAATELPDLGESWLWAHAQAVSEAGRSDAEVAASGVISDASKEGLAQELKALPARNISRLVCPRRLEARHDYLACVVPATEGGRLRGLGQPFAAADLGAAWGGGRDVELPVYFHWEFSTGPVGDIETLARRLKTPKKYAGDTALIASLKRIGEQDVAVDADHLLFNGVRPDATIFEGAMVSLNFQPVPPNATFAARLQDMLNSGQASSTTGAELPDDVPTLSPPMYGEHPAKRHTVDATRVAQHWLDGLNCQPRYRLASGWGAEVVRQNQDEFMQAAWEQVGDVLAAERAFSLARLSRDVLKRIEARHLAKLPPERLLAILSPARARIRVTPTASLYGQIEAATLPHELFDGSMRRLTSARRPTFRMAQWRGRATAHAPVAAQVVTLVRTFAEASTHLAAVDPNRFVPDGLMGSSSFDGIVLPADPAARVNLAPYLGLDATMTGAEIRTIQAHNAAARRLAATLPRTAPAMDDVWRRGLITETHARRITQLEEALGHPLAGDVARLIQNSSTPSADGVLLSVSGGRVSSQPLSIDASSGTIRTAASVRRTLIKDVTAPHAATVATIPVQALQMYGSRSVLATLPVSTVVPGAMASVSLARPGRFTAVALPRRELATITVPAAIKDAATLTRYADAFRNYQQMVVPAAGSVPAVRAVDFAMSASVAEVRRRANPQETVPARLASMLSLGGEAVAWKNGVLSHLFVSSRLDEAFDARLRYVIPHTFDRVMSFPHLRFPLSRKLEQLAPEVFLPGVGTLPTDFIMAVKTNPRFVEALMLGANHEMERELLWQGFPTDSRGTPFQRFWQRLDDEDDIAPIHKWAKVPLGQQPGNTPKLVLLFRGQLLERFPTLSIYAYRIEAPTQARPGGSVPPVANDPREMNAQAIVTPFMRGHLFADITYVGFNIAPENIADYFFVIEEHMTEPRFGFDETDGPPSPNKSWLDVDWREVGVAPGQHLDGAKLVAASQGVANVNAARWLAPNAATVADAILQRPFRGYWRGESLEMP
ncbi:MAG TPA: hypothetical protein VM032_08755 [Vicinamibacterales bacterium]|nr:hypothetical protein [Vicinamibacterales bacterium]